MIKSQPWSSFWIPSSLQPPCKLDSCCFRKSVQVEGLVHACIDRVAVKHRQDRLIYKVARNDVMLCSLNCDKND